MSLPSRYHHIKTIKDRKHELVSKIRVIDNLIPDYDSNFYRERYRFQDLKSNYYTDGKIGDDGRLVAKFSTKLILYTEIALANVNYGKLKKIHSHVFLVSDIDTSFKEVMHIDDTAQFENGYTLSYHFMGEDNCGGTSFYETSDSSTPLIQVPFKQNRLVVFPACIPHTGYANPGYAYKSKRVIYTLFSVLDM